jgi:hypothetical protein
MSYLIHWVLFRLAKSVGVTFEFSHHVDVFFFNFIKTMERKSQKVLFNIIQIMSYIELRMCISFGQNRNPKNAFIYKGS